MLVWGCAPSHSLGRPLPHEFNKRLRAFRVDFEFCGLQNVNPLVQSLLSPGYVFETPRVYEVDPEI